MEKQPIAQWAGMCPICLKSTIFVANDLWFRDNLFCTSCEGGSLPRERALMLVLRQLLPHWPHLAIHESSPVNRGASIVLAAGAPGYVSSQFWPDVVPGEHRLGIRCENLEAQTFASESFDLVVTQDVMEHVFNPEKAHQEIYRTLRPGGYHIHTVPIYKHLTETVCRARLESNGSVTHLAEPEYHGNPVDLQGSLVTFHYGYDVGDRIAQWAPFDVEIRRFHDRTHGIVAEFSEVVVCEKPY